MRKRCSLGDYGKLSAAERKQLRADFVTLLRQRFPHADFGYDSFPDLEYEEWVFSEIFRELKEARAIVSVGYMTFRLA